MSSLSLSRPIQFLNDQRLPVDEDEQAAREKRYQTKLEEEYTHTLEREDMTTITNESDHPCLKEEIIVKKKSDFRFHMASNVNR